MTQTTQSESIHAPVRAPEVDDCIRSCLEAARACLKARQHCALRGGRLSDPRLLSLLLDSAEVSELSARWLQRSSSCTTDLCGLTATLCKSAETACRAFADEDPLAECADQCNRAVDTCLRMGTSEPVLTH